MVKVRVLGPLELRVGDVVVPIAGPKQRAVLAALALEANRVVSVGSLVDAVWGDFPPARAEHTLQQHISAVRKLLESDRAAGPDAQPLVTRSPGYSLNVDQLDVDEFERSASEGRDAASSGYWVAAVAAFDTALAWWRGPALANARDTAKLSSAGVRLDEQRLAVVEDRFDARLECGQAREVVPELEQVVDEHPLRERLRGQLMLALYRCGRQADALAAYQSARRALTEDLGIEPSAALRELEQAILMQRPELDDASVAEQREQRELHATFGADSSSGSGRMVLPDGQIVLLADGVSLIGRDHAARIQLVDSRVSRRHAQVESTGNRIVLRDLGSTNGTTVNGRAADVHDLRDGDVVSVGGVELRFHRSDA